MGYGVSSCDWETKDIVKQIVEEEVVGDYLIVAIRFYPRYDYDGIVILVYKGFSSSKELLGKLTWQGAMGGGNSIDIEFRERDPENSPVAHFRYCDDGIRLANLFIKALKEELITKP